eukprot:m51a1_g10457 hypothetical protein (675) ;mRNA; f:26217-30008
MMIARAFYTSVCEKLEAHNLRLCAVDLLSTPRVTCAPPACSPATCAWLDARFVRGLTGAEAMAVAASPHASATTREIAKRRVEALLACAPSRLALLADVASSGVYSTYELIAGNYAAAERADAFLLAVKTGRAEFASRLLDDEDTRCPGFSDWIGRERRPDVVECASQSGGAEMFRALAARWSLGPLDVRDARTLQALCEFVEDSPVEGVGFAVSTFVLVEPPVDAPLSPGVGVAVGLNTCMTPDDVRGLVAEARYYSLLEDEYTETRRRTVARFAAKAVEGARESGRAEVLEELLLLLRPVDLRAQPMPRKKKSAKASAAPAAPEAPAARPVPADDDDLPPSDDDGLSDDDYDDVDDSGSGSDDAGAGSSSARRRTHRGRHRRGRVPMEVQIAEQKRGGGSGSDAEPSSGDEDYVEQDDDDDEAPSDAEEAAENRGDATGSDDDVGAGESAREERQKEERLDTERSVYVGRLPHDSSEQELRALFGSFGPVTRMHIPKFKDTGRPRGSAFVEFKSADSVARACRLDGSELRGCFLKVNPAADKPTVAKHAGASSRADSRYGIYVGNLSFATNEKALARELGSCGKVIRVNMPLWHDSGRKRGFAVVEFTSREAATRALEYNGRMIDGRQVVVRKVEAGAHAKRPASKAKKGGAKRPRPDGAAGASATKRPRKN